jgi:hypothetical protein
MTGTFGERVAHQSRVAGDELGEAVGQGLPVFVPCPSCAGIAPCPDRVRAFASASADAANPAVSSCASTWSVHRSGPQGRKRCGNGACPSIKAASGFFPKAAGWAGEYDWHVRRTGSPSKPGGRGRVRRGRRQGVGRVGLAVFVPCPSYARIDPCPDRVRPLRPRRAMRRRVQANRPARSWCPSIRAASGFCRRPQAGPANMTGTFGERVAQQSRLAGDEVGEAVGQDSPVFVPCLSCARVGLCPDRIRPFAPGDAGGARSPTHLRCKCESSYSQCKYR